MATMIRDMLASVPALLADPAGRRELELVMWEAAARGESSPTLGAWAMRHPDALDALVLAAEPRGFAARLRATRALAVIADGVCDADGLLRAERLVAFAVRGLGHPEPAMWTHAARALGRMAARVAAARAALAGWTRGTSIWRRRRAAAALAAVPPGGAADAWIDDEVDRLLEPAAARVDPWHTAALAVAAPQLARERPDAWHALLELAEAGSLPILWSVAHGLAMLGRRGPRMLAEDERELARRARAQLDAMPARSTEDAARACEAAAALDRALGAGAPPWLAFEALDDAIRTRFDAVAAATPPDADTVAAALAGLDAADEATRGRAHAILRSATRAAAAQLGELAGVASGLDTAALWATIEGQLRDHICEYGLRATLIGCAGDLVELEPRGRSAARAARVVTASRWAREEVLGGAPAGAARAVRRFRHVLEDLCERCVPAPDGHAVAPALAAWFAACAGGAELVAGLCMDGSTERAALASIPRALGDAAFGATAEHWASQLAGALASLGAGDTLLAATFARLAAALDAAAADDVPDPPRDELAQLAAAIDALVQVAADVEIALARAHIAEAAAPVGVLPPDPRSRLEAWERELPPALAAIALPVAGALVDRLERAGRPRIAGGEQIGGFELLERLGGGGMGEVWKARRGRQLVALKLPLRHAERGELRAEAGRLEQLSLAKIATFIDAGVDRGVPFLATVYLRGRTWYEHALAPGAPRMSPELASRLARDVCTGLANLHELGLVHRDVTPRNVFLRFRGRDPAPVPALVDDPRGARVDEAVLIDLGIAQAAGAPASEHVSLGYIAPEVLLDQPVHPAADVYGLGATVFHVLTGRRFAEGLERGAAVAWHVGGEAFDDPAVREAARALPTHLADLIRAATRRDPGARPTVEAFDAAL